MATLASLITNRFEFYNGVQPLPKKTDDFELDEVTKTYKRIKPRKPPMTKENWYECKKYVDHLPGEYRPLIEEKIKQGKVDKIQRNKGYELIYTNKYLDFTIELNIFENFLGEVKSAKYFAYSTIQNVCYIRDLFVTNALSNF